MALFISWHDQFFLTVAAVLSPNKRIENFETLHPVCLGSGRAHSSPAIRLSVSILQTQAPVSLQGSRYLPATASSPSITNTSEVLHPLLYFRPFCSSASESLRASVLPRACGTGRCHLGKRQDKTGTAQDLDAQDNKLGIRPTVFIWKG